jgi:NADH-quinone oxidoreductase subunit F
MTPFDRRLLPPKPDASYGEYRARTGPDAVARARALSPDQVITELQRSGLRGRGGAGFPTGTKWRAVAHHACPVRSVVCNAAEGEPGTFKDRWLLRQSPYATLEGMLIAAHVAGTADLYIALKASFQVELARVKSALDEMKEVIGRARVKVVEGPEEYLFGEEKALLEVVEGNDPLPREADNPPYEEGLFATVDSPNPAIVNNAETFAHAAFVLRSGAAAFRKLGTDDTPGTLLFTVSGDVQRPGVHELPAGITLSELFNEVAGGPRPGRTLRAALSGVSNRVIPANRFGTRADFGSLQLAGSGLGSAGFMVFDDQAGLPRVAQSIARFLYVESCNQCSACKAGLRLASRAMDRALTPKGTAQDLSFLRSGARSAPQGNRCALPAEAAALLPSFLAQFASDFQRAVGAEPLVPVWPIPKLTDYDEATHTFKIDEHQQHKRPDWTYEPSHPSPPLPRARPASVPHDAGHSALNVPLRSETHAELARYAEESGVTVEELVERAVSHWLPKQPRH